MTWELTPELEESILSRLEDGEGLLKICRAEDMPSRRTVLRWQRENEDFGARCAQAREAQGDLAAEQQDDIAERCLAGEIPADVARAAISAKQWRASKLAAKKYGDKLAVGGDSDAPPVQHAITAVDDAIITQALALLAASRKGG